MEAQTSTFTLVQERPVFAHSELRNCRSALCQSRDYLYAVSAIRHLPLTTRISYGQLKEGGYARFNITARFSNRKNHCDRATPALLACRRPFAHIAVGGPVRFSWLTMICYHEAYIKTYERRTVMCNLLSLAALKS